MQSALGSSLLSNVSAGQKLARVRETHGRSIGRLDLRRLREQGRLDRLRLWLRRRYVHTRTVVTHVREEVNLLCSIALPQWLTMLLAVFEGMHFHRLTFLTAGLCSGTDGVTSAVVGTFTDFVAAGCRPSVSSGKVDGIISGRSVAMDKLGS